MFIIIGENNKRIEFIPYRENEEVYLFKSDEYKFPMLSLLDYISHSFFNVEDMAQLAAELSC